MSKLMTVEEFAEYFRTTTTTVYRWLKQGKIQGIKIGKEWRLNEDAIQAMINTANTDHHDEQEESFVWADLNENEHLMALTESRDKVFELEASFFQYALEHGKHMMKGCWWQDPDEIEEIYQTYGLDTKNLTKDGLFKIVDFTRQYKKYGINGPVECWKNEIVRNRRNSLWASGSPSLSCCDNNENNILSFERKLNNTIKDMPIIGICPYSIEEFTGTNFYSLIPLMRHHSGILYYDKENSMLLRN